MSKDKIQVVGVRVVDGKLFDREATIALLNAEMDKVEAQEACLNGPVPLAVNSFFAGKKGEFVSAGQVYDLMLTSGDIKVDGFNSLHLRDAVLTYMKENSGTVEECVAGTKVFVCRKGRHGGTAVWAQLPKETQDKFLKKE